MNDDELKKLWQEQPLRDPAPSPALLVSAMQSKATVLRRCLDGRDLRELVACAVIIIVFIFFYFTVYIEPMARLGDLIVIGGAIFIAAKLIYTRWTTAPAPAGATVVESLRAELKSVRAQSGLLGSVLWWYLLPLTVGEIIATWGLRANLHAKIPVTVVILAVNAFVYWINQRAREKQLLPLEAQLEALLRSAETGEPVDEIHVTSLRPIALSMAAAGQVKPAEFQVAFWQIAFLGEIGFVGFWFFGILALNGDVLKDDWLRLAGRTTDPFQALMEIVALLFTWPHLVWLVVFFLGGLVYSWLMQKLTRRAVGISTLGVHLHGGLTLILWDEIKEVRPLKALYIRSLWLIRESGEKTIMPWSSLERHSDLKAAVESCAPVGHPLRERLSLLK